VFFIERTFMCLVRAKHIWQRHNGYTLPRSEHQVCQANRMPYYLDQHNTLVFNELIRFLTNVKTMKGLAVRESEL